MPGQCHAFGSLFRSLSFVHLRTSDAVEDAPFLFVLKCIGRHLRHNGPFSSASALIKCGKAPESHSLPQMKVVDILTLHLLAITSAASCGTKIQHGSAGE